MGLFYTMSLESLWTNATYPTDYSFNGIIQEYTFNLISKEEILESIGYQKT